MNSDRDLLDEVFEAARSLAPAAREALISSRLGSSPLADEARRLLDAHDRNRAGFLDSPLLGPAFNVIDAGAQNPEPRPDTIGPYRIVATIAEGDWSLVYAGEQDSPIHRRVAIKVLRSLSQRREVLRRFEAERRAIALMDHPCIARLFEAGTTSDGRAYFVMELVDGRPITAAARELPARERLALFLDVCRAIEHAHQRGVIHRDLKPSNILVTADGKAKIIDFGIAKAVAGADDLTLTGQMIGTPAYMSPEQLRGRAAPDTRSDVYSLGVVLYELLAGRPPYDLDGATPAAIAAMVLTEPARPLRNLAPLADAAPVVAKAMEKDAERRYSSVAELRDDLERVLRGEPVRARRPGPVYIARRFVGRHRVASLVVGTSVLTAAAALWRAHDAQTERLDLAIDLARSLHAETMDIATTVGERGRRRPLVERLDVVSAQLQQRAPNDPRVLDMRADILAAVADLEQQQNRYSAAREVCERVLAIRERLAGNDFDGRADISVAIVRVGDMARLMGERETGAAMYRRALAIDEALVQEEPASSRALTLLGWSYDRLGHLEHLREDLFASREFRRRQLEIFERLAEVEDSPATQRALCATHGSLGTLAGALGEFQTQHFHARQALEHAHAAAAKDPANRQARASIVGGQMSVLRARQRAKLGTVSVSELTDAVAAADALVSLDPADSDFRHVLATVLTGAMAAAENENLMNEAIAFGKRAVAEWDRLAAEQPENQEVRFGQQNTRVELSRVEAR